MSKKTQITVAEFKNRLDAGKVDFLFDMHNIGQFSYLPLLA